MHWLKNNNNHSVAESLVEIQDSFHFNGHATLEQRVVLPTNNYKHVWYDFSESSASVSWKLVCWSSKEQNRMINKCLSYVEFAWLAYLGSLGDNWHNLQVIFNLSALWWKFNCFTLQGRSEISSHFPTFFKTFSTVTSKWYCQ